MTQDIINTVNPKRKSLIIDIGSNDGVTLQHYNKQV